MVSNQAASSSSTGNSRPSSVGETNALVGGRDSGSMDGGQAATTGDVAAGEGEGEGDEEQASREPPRGGYEDGATGAFPYNP